MGAYETRMGGRTRGTWRGYSVSSSAPAGPAEESVILVDTRGVVQMLNGAASVRLGLARELGEVVSAADLDEQAIPSHLVRTQLPYVQEVARSKRPIHIREEREGIASTSSYYPVFDSGGRVSHIAIVSRDVADQTSPGSAAGPGQEPSPRFVGPALAPRHVATLRPLTAAERKVLNLILDGNSNKEIACLLHRSKRTVEVHRNHIMQKLQAHNAVDLVMRLSSLATPPVEAASR